MRPGYSAATFQIDQGGAIAGADAGPAEWDGPEPRAPIEHYLNRPEEAAGVTKTGG